VDDEELLCPDGMDPDAFARLSRTLQRTAITSVSILEAEEVGLYGDDEENDDEENDDEEDDDDEDDDDEEEVLEDRRDPGRIRYGDY
jgi:hypothetical protein